MEILRSQSVTSKWGGRRFLSFEADMKKFNEQYTPIAVTQFNTSHDRFLIIDEPELYHIGAFLNDFGRPQTLGAGPGPVMKGSALMASTKRFPRGDVSPSLQPPRAPCALRWLSLPPLRGAHYCAESPVSALSRAPQPLCPCVEEVRHG